MGLPLRLRVERHIPFQWRQFPRPSTRPQLPCFFRCWWWQYSIEYLCQRRQCFISGILYNSVDAWTIAQFQYAGDVVSDLEIDALLGDVYCESWLSIYSDFNLNTRNLLPVRNTYSLFNFGDFVDGSDSNVAAPYMQFLSVTDPKRAHNDFVNLRLGGVDTTGSQLPLTETPSNRSLSFVPFFFGGDIWCTRKTFCKHDHFNIRDSLLIQYLGHPHFTFVPLLCTHTSSSALTPGLYAHYHYYYYLLQYPDLNL